MPHASTSAASYGTPSSRGRGFWVEHRGGSRQLVGTSASSFLVPCFPPHHAHPFLRNRHLHQSNRTSSACMVVGALGRRKIRTLPTRLDNSLADVPTITRTITCYDGRRTGRISPSTKHEFTSAYELPTSCAITCYDGRTGTNASLGARSNRRRPKSLLHTAGNNPDAPESPQPSSSSVLKESDHL